MDPLTALLAFTMAALLMTITPGLDTALVLRTAVVENRRTAFSAGLGIALGTLGWGILTALGLGALIAVSQTAYGLLRIAGAAYLLWLGGTMILAALRPPPGTSRSAPDMGEIARQGQKATMGRWLWRGALTNLLNPKVGAFYVSFLPQFIPAGGDIALYSVIMAAIHAALALLWFAVLIHATRPIAEILRKPAATRLLEGLTGSVLMGFGARIALDRAL